MPKMITMKDLLQAGILKPNEQLSCERDSEFHIGYLSSDGKIQFGNGSFSSPSAWSGHIKDRNSNGWKEVFARGRNLDFFREEFRQKQRDAMATNSGKTLLPSSTQERGSSVADTSDIYEPEPMPDIPPPNHNMNTEPNEKIADLSNYIQNLNQKIANIEQRITTSGGESKTSIVDDLRSRVLNLTPTDFERLVGEFMKAKGFSNVRVTQQSSDGGIGW